MILDRRQSRWVLGTGATAAFALGVFFVYASQLAVRSSSHSLRVCFRPPIRYFT